MSTEHELPPLPLQAALTASPALFIGIPAWVLSLVLSLFDIQAGTIIAALVACVLPPAIYLFARWCAAHGLIRADASPLALALLQSAAAAVVVWVQPLLPSSWGSSSGPGGGGVREGPAGLVLAAIVVAAGCVALMWPRRRTP